jgi:hypothetical protein
MYVLQLRVLDDYWPGIVKPISALIMVTGGWFMALYGVAALDLDVLLYEHGFGVTF